MMKGFFRTFSAAFIFKTSLAFFTALFAGRLSFKRIKKIYLDPDSIQFGIFVGLMSFTYKVILCTLRHIRKKDPIYHKTIAGSLHISPHFPIIPSHKLPLNNKQVFLPHHGSLWMIQYVVNK